MLVDFSERLKRLRREKGYSQAALAQKVSDMGQNLSEAALAKYESSRTYPNLQVAASLADYFGVSIDYLACGEKASVISVDGLTDEQVDLVTELARSLQQQNKNHGHPKIHPDTRTAGIGV